VKRNVSRVFVALELIGRLAWSERVRGQGIGELLLADAIKRVPFELPDFSPRVSHF
jgi:hypothetical protein